MMMALLGGLLVGLALGSGKSDLFTIVMFICGFFLFMKGVS